MAILYYLLELGFDFVSGKPKLKVLFPSFLKESSLLTDADASAVDCLCASKDNGVFCGVICGAVGLTTSGFATTRGEFVLDPRAFVSYHRIRYMFG